MIYSIFMRKMKGDSKPFPVSVVVNNFISKYIGKHDVVLSFPGYMSTIQDNIDDFFKEIHFPAYTFFTRGMNGERKLNPPCKTIQDAHNGKTQLNIVRLKNTYIDHAKMMFFLENKHKIGCIDIDYLLNLRIKAVLIGSSNQSYTTYLNPVADKGEADVLLIDGNFIGADTNTSRNNIKAFFEDTIERNRTTDEHENEQNNFVNENLRRRLALFEELLVPNDFLYNIYEETIQKLYEN